MAQGVKNPTAVARVPHCPCSIPSLLILPLDDLWVPPRSSLPVFPPRAGQSPPSARTAPTQSLPLGLFFCSLRRQGHPALLKIFFPGSLPKLLSLIRSPSHSGLAFSSPLNCHHPQAASLHPLRPRAPPARLPSVLPPGTSFLGSAERSRLWEVFLAFARQN